MFFLIRPVGLMCQLKCTYCYYKYAHENPSLVSPLSMQIDTIKRLLDGLGGIPGEHTFCLHGGEPLLIGKDWFAEFLRIISEYNQNYTDRPPLSVAVQTNGLAVDEEWIKLFQLGNVGVSISLDGPKFVHDYVRVSSKNIGTHARVLSRINLMANSGIRLGALAVISSRTLEMSPASFYRYFKKIPLVNGLDISPYIETGTSEIELKAQKYLEPDPHSLSNFLNELFDIWLLDSDTDSKTDIRMFRQLVGIALGFVPTLCSLTQGASCGRTPNLMPNGDIYACDLDVHGFDFRLGSVYEESIADICSEKNLSALHHKIINGLKLRGCTDCHLIAYCGLTCPRHSFSRRDHSDYCAMMETLVNHAKKRLSEISYSITQQPIDFHSW